METATRSPTARDTLADRVAQGLLSAVADGSFPTGHQLPSEGQIASSFGVGRAVVREALGHLKAIGVVHVTNGKRAVVKPLDSVPLAQFFSLAAVQGPNNLSSLLEVRCGIESETAFLAAERRTDEDLEVLQRLIHEMGTLARSKALFDPRQYAELDRAFHLEVARASKNLLLEQLALSIREPMKESILAGLRTQSSLRQRRSLQAGHDKIADAIKRGDSETAQLAMRSHMIGAASRLILAETASTRNTDRTVGTVGPTALAAKPTLATSANKVHGVAAHGANRPRASQGAVRHAQERAPPSPRISQRPEAKAPGVGSERPTCAPALVKSSPYAGTIGHPKAIIGGLPDRLSGHRDGF